MNDPAVHECGDLLAGGVFTALPTPFSAGTVDVDGLVRLCERQIDRGTAALVACGSTGEAASLLPDEYRLVIRIVAETAAGRVPVIAGCSAQSTDVAIERAIDAVVNGATALLCAAPAYVKPTQDGIIGHLKAIHGAVKRPILAYDVPSRTGVSIADDTLARLHEQGIVVGLKDATADLSRPPRLRALCGERFLQMSGDDATSAAYRAAGGHGCISVTANITPNLCNLMHRSWAASHLTTFGTIRDQVAELSDLLFLESNPIPVKAALSLLGLIEAELRLPLTSPRRETLERLARPLAAVMTLENALAVPVRYRLVS